MKLSYEAPELETVWLAANVKVALLEELESGVETPTKVSQADIDIPLQ